MQYVKPLTCFLLVITASGIYAEDAGRVKRSDEVKNAMDAAKDAAKDALASANDILKNLGLDLKNLPKDLMQMASTLFQASNTTAFQGIMSKVMVKLENKTKDEVTMDTMQKEYKKLLNNQEFMKEVKTLMDQSQSNTDDPKFKTGMEGLLEKYLESALGGTGGLAASGMCLLLAVGVYLGLV